MDDSFWDERSLGPNIDAPSFLDSSVVDELGQILALGVLVSLGATRDGGAIGVAVFNDGRRRREYFRDSTDAADFLRSARAAISGNGVGALAGDADRRRKPPRGA